MKWVVGTTRRGMIIPLVIFLLPLAASETKRAGLVYYLALRGQAQDLMSIEGQPAEKDTFVGETGATPILRTKDPVLEIPREQIQEAHAYEIALASHDPLKGRTPVRIKLSTKFEQQLDRIYEQHRDVYLLVGLNGSLVELESLAGYPSAGFPGGIFPSMKAAEAAYSAVGVDLLVERALPAQIAEKERYERDYRAAVLWFAKCDADSFAVLRREGIEAVIGPVDAAKDSTEVDCGKAAPVFPPAPPGRKEMCTEWAEAGDMKSGRPDGVWSVRNPYGEEIRLDFYREGQRVGSTWLRECGRESRSVGP